MNKIHKLYTALVLVLVLSLSTFAGDISTGVVAPPPPPPAASSDLRSEEIQSTKTDLAYESNILVLEIGLSLLRTLRAF